MVARTLLLVDWELVYSMVMAFPIRTVDALCLPRWLPRLKMSLLKTIKLLPWNVYWYTSGELFGIPPTGKQVTFSVVHVDRVVDGKVVEHWGQGDTMSLMQQLGVLPLPQWG